MANRKWTTGQIIIYKTLHRLSNTNFIKRVNSGAPEGEVVPAPLVAYSLLCCHL